jgi:UDP-GlcNAc:undecaprenyl-phosphate/decaprenyl-phosphate GlcNAc-1-phosphate transferase
MIQLVPAAIAIFVASVVLAGLLRWGRMPTDTPNARSLHRAAVPRGAGIAIWIGVAAAAAWLPQGGAWLVPLALVIGVSLWDDYRGVPVTIRLVAQTVAALAWVGASLPWPMLLAVVLAIVWMANLYNFMDGSDGLAGAMTVVGFGACAIAAWSPATAESQLMLAVAAATLPFLALNWPPARLFLGDVGAVPLGFLAGALGFNGWQSGWWPVWFPILVFLPFIVDATVTLVGRLLSGQRVLEAHRDHAYQRLVRGDFGHAGTLLLYATLMFGTAASALAALVRAPSAGVGLLALWTLVLLLLHTWIGYHWRKARKEPNASKR